MILCENIKEISCVVLLLFYYKKWDKQRKMKVVPKSFDYMRNLRVIGLRYKDKNKIGEKKILAVQSIYQLLYSVYEVIKNKKDRKQNNIKIK